MTGTVVLSRVTGRRDRYGYDGLSGPPENVVRDYSRILSTSEKKPSVILRNTFDPYDTSLNRQRD